MLSAYSAVNQASTGDSFVCALLIVDSSFRHNRVTAIPESCRHSTSRPTRSHSPPEHSTRPISAPTPRS